jgi:hypothetical protein
VGFIERLIDKLATPLIPPPQLEPGERIVWEGVAGIVDRIAHAGNLYVTQKRVIYLDNKTSSSSRRINREWRLDSIESIGIAQRDWTPYTGGMRRRLRMTTTEGDVLFNFGHLDERMPQLQEAIFKEPENSSP